MPLNKLIEKLREYRQAAEDGDGFLHTNERMSNPEVYQQLCLM